MGHREIVMQRTGAVRKTSAPMIALHLMIGALGFGLRPCASFQEKLRQLVGK
jgi:hypothetical protein